jgi:hypothetical protein
MIAVDEPWCLREKEDCNGLDGRSGEEDSQRDSIRVFAVDCSCTKIHGGADYGANGELSLVHRESNTAKMCRRNLVYVELRESQEPANRNASMVVSFRALIMGN